MIIAGRTQPLSAYPVEEALRRLRALGFEGVEVCLENPDLAPDTLSVERARVIRNLLTGLGFLSWSVSYHRDYVTDDECFVSMQHAIALTREFGADTFVIGCPRASDDPAVWEGMVERTRALAALAAEHDVILAEEFEPGFLVGTTADLLRLFDQVDAPNLVANVDLGHAFLQDPNPLAAITSLGDRIAHVHIENMNTGVHDHQLPYEGDMDLAAYVEALRGTGFDGLMALDLYRHPYEEVAPECIAYLQDLIGGQRSYPLLFEPQLRDYIWGGRNLEAVLGRELPPGDTAESWEISGHPTAPTVALNGYWRGRTLPQVLDAMGVDLAGANAAEMLARSKFPLLVKILDAQSPLSVQVHPDDAFANEHENGELGKLEAWYVIHAEPGAELICGLCPGTNPEMFRQAISDNTLADHLSSVAVREGDVVFIPAGTVHALQAGIMVVEVQQNSDTTYRVYDWGRADDDGQLRELHIRKAMQVIDWSIVDPGLTKPVPLEGSEGVQRWSLVPCAKFCMEKVVLAPGASLTGECDGATFEIWGCIDGEAMLRSDTGRVVLERIRFTLLPANLGAYTLSTATGCTMLRVYLPPLV